MSKAQITKNNQQKTINKKSGFGPRSAILVTLAIYFGAQIIAGVLLGSYLSLTGHSREEITSLASNSVIVGFSFFVLAQALSLWFLWQFLRYRKISFSEIGVKKPNFENILAALPAYVAYFALFSVAFLLLRDITSIDTEQEQQIGFDGASGLLPLTLVFISLVILPAVVEEIMVRGFLYGGLIKKYSKISAAIIASVIFGIAHLQLGSGEPPLWIAAADTFILSMVLIYLREVTGNIWAGVVVHIIKNSFAFLRLFVL